MKHIKHLIALSALIVVFVGGGASPAAAGVECGDTITRNARLTQDLNCSTEPGLTVVGPARLNMKGFSLTCETTGTGVGISIQGRRAKIHGGSVQDCDTGVEVAGAGRHHIFKITVSNNSDGFLVSEGSDDNKFTRNVADDNNEGWQVDSTGNTFVNNTATNNFSDGFQASSTGGENTYVNNTVTDNFNGFDLSSDGNRFHNNTVIGNRNGFVIDGNFNKFTNNTVTGQISNGFDVNADGNRLFKNEASDNLFGIRVQGGTGDNSMTKNMAFNNSNTDLFDGNPDCGTNRWTRNKFGTSDPDCID